MQRVIVGKFEVRHWNDKCKEWVVGLNKKESEEIYLPGGSSRFDIRYILDIQEWIFSRVVVDEFGGKIYPWFGTTGTMPLAAFPDYWSAKKFVVDYVEPNLLMKKMSESC